MARDAFFPDASPPEGPVPPVVRSGDRVELVGGRAAPVDVSTTELDTPAVVVDVDRLQRNLERWQAYCDAAGLSNRPHVKTHKSVEIARRQIALGARGITCQKLGEAEVMADGGIDDILLPYNLLGQAKLDRLAELARRVDVAVTVDDVRLLEGLGRARARPLARSASSSSATPASAGSASRRRRLPRAWRRRSRDRTACASAASSPTRPPTAPGRSWPRR